MTWGLTAGLAQRLSPLHTRAGQATQQAPICRLTRLCPHSSLQIAGRQPRLEATGGAGTPSLARLPHLCPRLQPSCPSRRAWPPRPGNGAGPEAAERAARPRKLCAQGPALGPPEALLERGCGDPAGLTPVLGLPEPPRPAGYSPRRRPTWTARTCAGNQDPNEATMAPLRGPRPPAPRHRARPASSFPIR